MIWNFEKQILFKKVFRVKNSTKWNLFMSETVTNSISYGAGYSPGVTAALDKKSWLKAWGGGDFGKGHFLGEKKALFCSHKFLWHR